MSAEQRAPGAATAGQPAAHDRLTWLLGELLSRPVSLAIFVITLVVLGIFSLLRLPVALLPSLERPRLEIELKGRELDRASLLEEVVAPLERRLLPLDGVAAVAATVDDGRALLQVDGHWQADSERMMVEIERLLATLPAGRLESAATRAAPPDRRPVLRLALVARDGEATELAGLATFAGSVLLPELGRLPGAGELRLHGGARSVLEVSPRLAELAARGLTFSELADRLRGAGRRQPLGQVRQGGELRSLSLGRPLDSLDQLARLSLGDGLTLGDVASFEKRELADGSLAFFRDRQAVLIDVFRAPGANAVLLARQGRALLGRLAAGPDLPGRLELIDDTSTEVVDSLGGLAISLLLGLLLGALILRIGLGRFRPTLALMVVVPASILASFAAFHAFAVPLDVVSLAGLALASGMLVDSSIVVLEAITLAGAAGAADPRRDGARQVALPLLASFVTTAVVFLPLLYLEGLARAFFGAQAFAIASSLGLSLIFSLTLTPLLCGSGKGRDGRQQGAEGASFAVATYRRLLEAALAHPGRLTLATLLLLAAAVPALLALPKTLMPEGLRRHLLIDLELSRGSEAQRRDQLAELTRRIAATTAAPFATEFFLPVAASDELAGRGRRQAFTAEGRGSLRLSFASPAALEEAAAAIAAASQAVPGLRASLHRERGALAAFADRLGSALELEILAPSEARAEQLAAAAGAALERAGFSLAARPKAPDEKIELRFTAARGEAPRLAAERELASLLDGEVLGELRISGLEAQLRLEPPPAAELGLLPIAVGEGDKKRLVPLAALAAIETSARPAPLERRGGRSSRLLEVPAGRDRQEAFQAALATVPRAAGEEIGLAGSSRELEEAFGQLELALGLGLLLVFLSIAALYESLRLPLVVIATVPCALAGAFFALLLAGQALDVFSFLGLVLLAGIVVNNAIVLIDRAEAARRQGETAAAAVRLAAAERYRPILMTTATTLLGLLPMALLGGEGAELRHSLATALCGGLVTSTLAVLFVCPLLYVFAAGRREQVA